VNQHSRAIEASVASELDGYGSDGWSSRIDALSSMHTSSTRTSGCQYRLQHPDKTRPRHGTDGPRISELYCCPFASRLQFLAIGKNGTQISTPGHGCSLRLLLNRHANAPRATSETLGIGQSPPSHREPRLDCIDVQALPNGLVARIIIADQANRLGSELSAYTHPLVTVRRSL